MINQLISLSLKNRYIVLLIAAALFGWGVYAVRENPIDAIPDLSENQVIVFTEWQGRSLDIPEALITTFRKRVQDVPLHFDHANLLI